jgi:hypothetical protein
MNALLEQSQVPTRDPQDVAQGGEAGRYPDLARTCPSTLFQATFGLDHHNLRCYSVSEHFANMKIGLRC